MRTKCILLPLSILVILALMLAACTTPAGQGAQSSGAAEVAPAEGGVTLVIWDFGGVDFEWLEKIAIPAFQEQHPDIKFEHVGIPEEELPLKLETAIAANQVPDLAVFIPARLKRAGHVLALDDFMERDGLKSSDFCSLFQSRDMLDGKVYSLPPIANIWAMVYNKDLFKAAGLPEPGVDTVITFDEWYEYAKAVNKPSDNLEERVWGSAHFVPNWNAMGNYMSDPFVLGADGRQCVGNADTDEWIHTWDIMVDAHSEDLTPETGGTLAGELSGEDLFMQGKLGMIYSTLGVAQAAQQQGLNVGLTGQPVVSEGWSGNVGGWTVSYGIMAGSQHPEEAWQFLKFLATEFATQLATDAGSSEVGGVPCYLPLADEFNKLMSSEPLVVDSLTLLQRIQPPPFTPNLWTSVDPFNEAWRRMTEDGVEPAVAVSEAAAECQEITDELWVEFDALKE